MGKNKEQKDEDTNFQESNININISNYKDLVIKIDNLTEYFRHFEIKAMDANLIRQMNQGGEVYNLPRSKPSSMTANLEDISNTIDDPYSWQ